MANASKLPSGRWNVKLYCGLDDYGKRIYKSFTADTKKEAEYMAAEYRMELERHNTKPEKTLTVKDAMEEMIELKKPTISPSTVRHYLQLYNGDYYSSIQNMRISDLNDKIVQKMINTWINKGLSPKTIQNIYSLFLSTVKYVDNRIIFNVRLPKQSKPDLYLPSEEEVNQLISESKDTLLELPIMFAAFMGLRRSEVVALKWEDIDMTKKRLYVNSATVIGVDNEAITKNPKSIAGKRYVDIPTPVYEALERHKNDDPVQVVPLTGSAIFNRFRKLQKKINMENFRFHDLRHFYASVMLALGIPDKYAMERIGHSSNAMLKNVYQHIINDKQSEFSILLDNYFSEQ